MRMQISVPKQSSTVKYGSLIITNADVYTVYPVIEGEYDLNWNRLVSLKWGAVYSTNLKKPEEAIPYIENHIGETVLKIVGPNSYKLVEEEV